MKLKEEIKNSRKTQNGITLIALVVTIVVLLILAGISINMILGDDGIIQKAKDAANLMNQAEQNDLEALAELTDELNQMLSEIQQETQKLQDLVGKKASEKENVKVQDEYGNKIVIPAGFTVVSNGTTDVTYGYSGDTSKPTVQDGIVIQDDEGNQFVWVPVGTIKNKDNTTNTITLGRYSDFTKQNGEYTPAQSAENYTQDVAINTYYKELTTFTEGNTATDSTAQNATARNLAEFISTTLANGGYYIARFEASGTAAKITSKYNQKVLATIPQPNVATAAREMYGEVKENNELLYASDLVNSYAWDTAIIFIQTYSNGTDASSYASQNKSTSLENTGINNDKYCNIWDMSGNALEWTTEYSTRSDSYDFFPCVCRGGFYSVTDLKDYYCASDRHSNQTILRDPYFSFRTLIYVK